MKRSSKVSVIVLIAVSVLIVVSIIAYGTYWAFFDIQRINGQEKIKEVSSPNQEYTVTAYLNNGGTTTDYAVLCKVTNNETGKERNIYWNYHCNDAEIVWLDETTVTINGVELDVLKDKFDWRTSN